MDCVASNIIQSCDQENQSTSMVNSKSDDPLFAVGTLVNVASRTWPGINKPGGRAKVKYVDTESRTYGVTYLLGGKEDGVREEYITEHVDDLGPRQRKKTTVVNVSVEEKKKRKPLPSILTEKKEKCKMIKKKPRKKKIETTEIVTEDSNTQRGDNFDDVALHTEDNYSDEMDYSESENDEYLEYQGDREDFLTKMNHEQQSSITMSEGTHHALDLLCDALTHCPRESEGMYLASVVEEYLISNGNCSKQDVEACFVQAEKENKIMLVDEDGTNTIYVI